jgi:RNA polymerase sigma-70 factor (ECF subfamily)
LPPRQRAALVLRDVLDFSTREVAETLNTTEDSVASALKRARTTLSHEVPSADQPPPLPDSPAERAALARLVQAFEASDADALAALMTDDVWVRMPPVPYEYQGRDLARTFFAKTAYRNGRRYRLVPTCHANGQPAIGVYLIDPVTAIPKENCLIVITLAGEQISAITRFEPAVFPQFGLAPALG